MGVNCLWILTVSHFFGDIDERRLIEKVIAVKIIEIEG